MLDGLRAVSVGVKQIMCLVVEWHSFVQGHQPVKIL